jgi:hypothetical protein
VRRQIPDGDLAIGRHGVEARLVRRRAGGGGGAAGAAWGTATFNRWSSGMNRDTGSVSRIFPSSTSIRIETPTTGLVIDMMRKIASFCIGFLASMSIRPCASKWAMWPWRATSVTAPEKEPPSIPR